MSSQEFQFLTSESQRCTASKTLDAARPRLRALPMQRLCQVLQQRACAPRRPEPTLGSRGVRSLPPGAPALREALTISEELPVM